MEIIYKYDRIPSADQVIELYNKSGLPRPTGDKNRVQKMFKNSDLVEQHGMEKNW